MASMKLGDIVSSFRGAAEVWRHVLFLNRLLRETHTPVFRLLWGNYEFFARMGDTLHRWRKMWRGRSTPSRQISPHRCRGGAWGPKPKLLSNFRM